MVKIRLRRIGTKGRPFYRVVVTPSTAGRNGRFVEVIGTYDPLTKPKLIKINEARALHWLMEGAQPSETAAILLNKTGVLEQYFTTRPKARADFKFLDKRTGLSSKATAVDAPVAEPAPAPAPAPEPAPAPVAEASAVEAEAPAAEESTAAEPTTENAE